MAPLESVIESMSVMTAGVVSTALVVFVVSLLATAGVRLLAERRGWVAMPREDRWHTRPTALHGGIGFVLVFLVAGTLVVAGRGGALTMDALLAGSEPSVALLGWGLLAGVAVMLAAGLVDDVWPLKPTTKLFVQILAASIFIAAGARFPLTGLVWLDTVVTYVWIVGITNAVNLLDNMDGLSAGVVAVSAGSIALLSLLAGTGGGESVGGQIALYLAAACLGFLWFNRAPARIFMGDSGALGIGFALAGLSVPTVLNHNLGLDLAVPGERVLVLLVPVMVASVPIFDTTLVALTRLLRAQSPSQGGRDHSSHRLVELGLSDRRAVSFLWTLAALGGGCALLTRTYTAQALPVAALYLLTMVLVGAYLGRVRLAGLPAIAHGLPARFAGAVHRFRVLVVLHDAVLIVFCYYTAYLLRFDGAPIPATLEATARSLPLVVTSCLLVFLMVGLYKNQWRLVTPSDVPMYVMAVMGGVVTSLAAVTLVNRFEVGHSRAAFVIFGLLLLIGLVGSRASFSVLDVLRVHGSRDGSAGERPVIIYGAGQAGMLLLEESFADARLHGYTVLGFADDASSRIGSRIGGLPVRSRRGWVKRSFPVSPEVWVSSTAIPTEQAMAFAKELGAISIVRRLRVDLEAVVPVEGVSGDLPRAVHSD